MDVQVALLDELETNFEPLTMVDIGAVAQAMDAALPLFFLEVVTEGIGEFLAGAKNLDRELGGFVSGGRTYRISLGQSVAEPDLLDLAVLTHEVDAPRTRTRRKTKRLESLWKYQRVRIYYPEELNLDVDRLLDFGVEIYSTASRWLQQQVNCAVSEKTISCEKLYATLRSITADEEVANSVWFVTAKDDHGFFLLDRSVVNAAIGRLADKAPRIDKSAFEVAGDMVTMYLSYESMHTKVAIASGRCIEVDLRDESEYAASSPELLDAEIAIYGGSRVAVYPLSAENPVLAAGFPLRNKKVLEPIFSTHGHRLVRQFRRFSTRLQRLISQLSRQSPFLNRAQAGEFIGGALVGALKRLYA